MYKKTIKLKKSENYSAAKMNKTEGERGALKTFV